MANELELREHVRPTIFNKDMAIGALAGNFVGGLIGGLLGGVSGVQVGRFIGVVGAGFLAGLKREKQMKKEMTEGRIVRPPSMWNKDTLLGGLIGMLVGGALSGLAVDAIIGTATVAAPVAATALGAIAVTLVGSTIIGGLIGGSHGKRRMTMEYQEAEKQLADTLEKNRSAQFAPEIAPDKAPVRSFRQQIELERQRTAQSQKTL